MKKHVFLLFILLFILLTFSVYSQTWTEIEGETAYQRECTLITKAQWDKLLEQYKEDNDKCILYFYNTLEIGTGKKVVFGTRPVLKEYYYIFEKRTTPFGWFPILVYGNSDTGRMEIWFSRTSSGVKIGSNEYTNQYNLYMSRVNNTPPPPKLQSYDINEPSINFDEYLPIHKISEPPKFNERGIASSLVYPATALRSAIEGRVVLELFVDKNGKVQSVAILREEPTGMGFGEAAINAFTGRIGIPAKANGEAVSCRYRYPVSFRKK